MPRLRWRLAAAFTSVAAALLLLPAGGQAAQLFGVNVDLEDSQATQRACEMLGPCTIVGFAERPAAGQLSTAGAPIDGVITKFRIKAKVETPGTQVTFRVANIAQSQDGEGGKSAKATAAGIGPTVTLQVTGGAEPVQEFPARLAVKKGRHLGLDAPSDLSVLSASNGGRTSYEFAPPLAEGAGERLSNDFLGFLLVQAAVEPDADGDGFGDETQDGCPTQAMTQGACDLTKPTIGAVRVRKGKILYRLSEPATVQLRLARKVGVKFKPLGRPFMGPGNAGLNRRALPRARRLASGAYRLSVSATDAAGNSADKKVRFRVGK